MNKLEELRELIDKTDDELLDVLARRMAAVNQVFLEKERLGLEIHHPERERLLVSRLTEKAAGMGLDLKFIERLLRGVVGFSRRQQFQRRVAARNPRVGEVKTISYQGAPGSYSWAAAGRHFGKSVDRIGCDSFGEALRCLVDGEVDRALLPIQNSIAGSIHEVYELLSEGDLHVVGEEYLDVDHCLLGMKGARIAEIRTVLSHPVALKQCFRFLRSLEGATSEACIDTAIAAEEVKLDRDPATAAIASPPAARLHGLEILRSGIGDRLDNRTRFWIIAAERYVPPERVPSVTSLLLATRHEEGALSHCLRTLAKRSINMLKLESHPIAGSPEFFGFYIDLEIHIAEERMVSALEELRAKAENVRVLGCYARDLI